MGTPVDKPRTLFVGRVHQDLILLFCKMTGTSYKVVSVNTDLNDQRSMHLFKHKRWPRYLFMNASGFEIARGVMEGWLQMDSRVSIVENGIHVPRVNYLRTDVYKTV